MLAHLGVLSRTWVKEQSELDFWQDRKNKEGVFSNSHFKYFFTEHFSLENDDFSEKKMLDIGCGPRGSLEWADMAAERVGLDPLADQYRKLAGNSLQMKLIKGYSEALPFPDDYFDVVSSFNSIDHVEDLEKTCQEIQRVLKNDGLFLLLTDVHDRPTVNEPQTISWSFTENYFTDFEILEERHFEKKAGGMYESLEEGLPFDHSDPAGRYGILSVKYRCRPQAQVE